MSSGIGSSGIGKFGKHITPLQGRQLQETIVRHRAPGHHRSIKAHWDTGEGLISATVPLKQQDY